MDNEDFSFIFIVSNLRELKYKLKIYIMIEMMFCNSDSVTWDIQHKEILYEIYTKQTIREVIEG